MKANVPSLIDTAALVNKVHHYSKENKIDNPCHLNDSRVYIYSGTKDTVVRTGRYSECVISQ